MIRVLVRGDRKQARWAAQKHGVKVVRVEKSNHGQTMLKVDATMEQVKHWYANHGGWQAPFAIGTCLYYRDLSR